MSDASMVNLAEDYLALRRKLGFAMDREGSQLLGFARYADRTRHSGPITTELALKWARLPEGARPLYWARRLDIVRRFARHRSAVDPRTEIPLQRLLGPSYRRMDPHIYSPEEIAALLSAAGNLDPVGKLRPQTYITLLGLLASTGLRISEALRLTRGDVNLNTGILTITETKFHKSRLVPVHPSTTKALEEYVERRDRLYPLAQARTFFLSDLGVPLKYAAVRDTFRKLRRCLEWRDHGGRRAPRIHDIRHTFACRRLLTWYEEGADVNQKLPALSTYLGHVRVSCTYWYFTAVPDLMAIASSRFESSGGAR